VEELRPPTVISERRERDERRPVADIGAEIRLEAPEGGDDRAGHAEGLLDLGEDRLVFLGEIGAAEIEPALRDHAVGEFEERLREHALRAVLLHDRRVETYALQAGLDGVPGNASRCGVLLEALKPGLETALGVTALRQHGTGKQRARHKHHP
jgi:hypothetical protein